MNQKKLKNPGLIDNFNVIFGFMFQFHDTQSSIAFKT